MTAFDMRDACESDFESILKLNDAEVQKTSQMDMDRLRLLDHLSSYHKVAMLDGHVAGFTLAIRAGAHYPNVNFSWFASRLDDFLYVDRIVVGSAFSGLKIGTGLYKDLFAYAKAQGISNITCEYNIEPPNLASRAFHDKFGFKELGRQRVAGNTKLVSLQAAAA
ncbi:MAG: GNAT family N-acetyltransferase [Gammaproteobacteria bacterium]